MQHIERTWKISIEDPRLYFGMLLIYCAVLVRCSNRFRRPSKQHFSSGVCVRWFLYLSETDISHPFTLRFGDIKAEVVSSTHWEPDHTWTRSLCGSNGVRGQCYGGCVNTGKLSFANPFQGKMICSYSHSDQNSMWSTYRMCFTKHSCILFPLDGCFFPVRGGITEGPDAAGSATHLRLSCSIKSWLSPPFLAKSILLRSQALPQPQPSSASIGESWS